MNAKKFYLLIVVVLLVGLLPQRNVSADTGPKPSMDFEFVQDSFGGKITIASGILYVCEKPDCSDAQPVMEKGMQGAHGFDCGVQSCNAQWDGNYFQLEIAFSDGVTRKSNIFGKSFFNAKYKVTINANSLVVDELEGSDSWSALDRLTKNVLLFFAGIIVFPLLIGVPTILYRKSQGKSNIQLGSCLVIFYMWLFVLWGVMQNYPTFLYTMFIELGISYGYFLFRKIKMGGLLFAIAAANAFTQPVFFFMVTRSSDSVRSLKIDHANFLSLISLSIPTMLITLFGEVLVWLFEAVIIDLMQTRQLSFKHILALTFVLNAASFSIGLLLPI